MKQQALNIKFSDMPMLALLGAQFLSALADNALLIAAIAMMKASGQPEHISWIQVGFVLPFIVLAPMVGALADALPKGRVLLIGNAIKLLGTCLMLLGAGPIGSYLLVGVGAAIYSPAKYGILGQFFSAEKLVKANGWLEGSTIAAILLGVLLGGILADRSIAVALISVLVIYATAAAINLLIPRISPEHDISKWDIPGLFKEFWQGNVTLMRDPAARMCLLGTSLFWGCGATLRLMLFAWVPLALGITNNQTPAELMGVLSIGIVIGAAIAALWVGLENVRRAYLGGLIIGPVIVVMAAQTNLMPVALLLLMLGIGGGLFVVPLNALLQQRGHQSVGAGRALAVQNLFENIAMLVLVSGYGLAEKLPVTSTVAGFGVMLFAGMAMLAWSSKRNKVFLANKSA